MSGALIDPEPLALFPLVRGALICDGGAIPGAALLFSQPKFGAKGAAKPVRGQP